MRSLSPTLRLLSVLLLSGVLAHTAHAQTAEEDEAEQLDEPDTLQPAPEPAPRILLQPPALLREAPARFDLPPTPADEWGDEEGWGDEEETPAGQPAEEAHFDDALDQALEGDFGEEPHEVELPTEHADPTAQAGHGANGEHGPAGAHGDAAGEHGGHDAHFDPVEFGATVINFLIWLAIIVFLARKPLGEFLRNRRRDVEEGLVEAERLEKEAKEKHAEYSERLAHLDEELEQLRGEMTRAGEAEADRIIAEAEARAARMRKDAQFVVDQQMKQLRADLTREAIEAAVTAAERVLTEQIGATDQERLAESYGAQLASSIEEEEVRA